MINIEEQHIDRLTETIYKLLNGQPAEILELPQSYPDNELKQLYTYMNQLIIAYKDLAEYIYALSRGELFVDAPKGKMTILHSFKNLQANLKHLTWVTQQISLGDFNHKVDFMGDFSVAFNDMTRQLKEAFETIQKANVTISEDKEKIDTLLHNVLPEKVIDELEQNGRSYPKVYDNVTVFFSDFVGFTSQSSEIDPVMLIDELNNMFSAFDEIVHKTGGERIKTIGDAFLAVWGMHTPMKDHAKKAVEASLLIIDYLKERNKDWILKWNVRIGLHSGSVVGGIVGVDKFIYDVFGDTVNTASRMESNSEPMRINVSKDVYELTKDTYGFLERGMIFVKGKGSCPMYFVKETE